MIPTCPLISPPVCTPANPPLVGDKISRVVVGRPPLGNTVVSPAGIFVTILVGIVVVMLADNVCVTFVLSVDVTTDVGAKDDVFVTAGMIKQYHLKKKIRFKLCYDE